MTDQSPTQKGVNLRKSFFRHYHRPANEIYTIIGTSRWECDRKKQVARSRLYRLIAIASVIAFFLLSILLLVSIFK